MKCNCLICGSHFYSFPVTRPTETSNVAERRVTYLACAHVKGKVSSYTNCTKHVRQTPNFVGGMGDKSWPYFAMDLGLVKRLVWACARLL